MKQKLIIILLALLWAMPQTACAIDFIDFSRPESSTPEVDIHAGVGMSAISENYADKISGCSEFFFNPGCQAAVGVNVEMPLRNYLYVGTGFDFAFSNYNWSMTILDAPAGTFNSVYNRNSFSSIEIPVYLGLKFNLGEKVRWINEIGFYISQGLGGKSKFKSYVSSTNSLGQSQVTTTSFTRDYYKDKDPIVCGISKTDFGLHLATGMMFNRHWTAKVVLHAGFRNMAINYDVLDISVRNIGLMFKAGYTF